jgi:hypothetical protein
VHWTVMVRQGAVFSCDTEDCEFQFTKTQGYLTQDEDLTIKCPRNYNHNMHIENAFEAAAAFCWACSEDSCDRTQSRPIPAKYNPRRY